MEVWAAQEAGPRAAVHHLAETIRLFGLVSFLHWPLFLSLAVRRKSTEMVKVARRDGEQFDCATWLHKVKDMPKEGFKCEVEQHLTGKETEPWEIMRPRSQVGSDTMQNLIALCVSCHGIWHRR